MRMSASADDLDPKPCLTEIRNATQISARADDRKKA